MMISEMLLGQSPSQGPGTKGFLVLGFHLIGQRSPTGPALQNLRLDLGGGGGGGRKKRREIEEREEENLRHARHSAGYLRKA